MGFVVGFNVCFMAIRLKISLACSSRRLPGNIRGG